MSGATVGGGRGSSTTTRGYRVDIEPIYLPDQSRMASAEDGRTRYIFGYRVRIANDQGPTAKLLSRRWLIVDGDGHRRIVEGGGVVGQRPVLTPGQVFEYSSFCPLETPWGTMEGRYLLQASADDGEGELFEVDIGRFYLVAPASERP